MGDGKWRSEGGRAAPSRHSSGDTAGSGRAKHDPGAVLFVGVFGLDTDQGCPASIDLCSAIEGALAGDGADEGLDGRQLLIRLANRRNRSHIKRYIEKSLKEHEARIIHAYLRRHPNAIDDFVAAIPDSDGASVIIGAAQGTADVAKLFGFDGLSNFMDRQTEGSDAMKMARRICREWLNDFAPFTPRRIDSVVRLLEKMDAQMGNGGRRGTLLDDLRSYMYGNTPMRESITKASAVFGSRSASQQQILVLISDGQSTDGNPMPVAEQLKSRGVDIATIFLTNEPRDDRSASMTSPHRAGTMASVPCSRWRLESVAPPIRSPYSHQWAGPCHRRASAGCTRPCAAPMLSRSFAPCFFHPTSAAPTYCSTF